MSDSPAAAPTQPLVAQIVASYLKKNQVALADISSVINTVYQSLSALGKAPEPTPQTPAVSIRQSVRPGYVVCLECGARGKSMIGPKTGGPAHDPQWTSEGHYLVTVKANRTPEP